MVKCPPSLPLGERAGLGRCCPGCWVQQPLDLELLLAITAIDGGPVRLLADFGDFIFELHGQTHSGHLPSEQKTLSLQSPARLGCPVLQGVRQRVWLPTGRIQTCDMEGRSCAQRWLPKTVSCVLTVASGRVTCLGHSLASVGPRLPKRPNGGRTQQKGVPQLAYKPPQLQPRAKTTSKETLIAAFTLTHHHTPLLAQAPCEPAQQFHRIHSGLTQSWVPFSLQDL